MNDIVYCTPRYFVYSKLMTWFQNINGFNKNFLARNPVSLCRMCECEYNFPNNRVHTGGNTQQQEFEYQAALTKYGGGTAKYYL